MADIEFEDVVKLAEQLKEDEQNRLILRLRVQQAAQHAKNISNQAQPARKEFPSLYGKFANRNAPDLSAEDLHEQLHAIASEWEQELDEFFGCED